MTYSQCCEIIRDICTPCSFMEIKKANKELKKHLDIVSINKTEDALSTIVWYEFVADGEVCCCGYDFWNNSLTKEE